MPPKVQPKTYILTLKTHKLTLFVTAAQTATINSIKPEALYALQSDVLQNRPGELVTAGLNPNVDIDDPEWQVPQVSNTDDFELCRAVKEKGRPTGQYEVLDGDATVKSSLMNWESVFLRFKDENGDLLPVKVSLPSLVEEEEEDVEMSKVSKGKRKARPGSPSSQTMGA